MSSAMERPAYRLRVAARSDVGRARDHNEDTFLIADVACRLRDLDALRREHMVRPCVMVIGVFDGMGGAAGGEVASALAADTVFDVVLGAGRPRGREELVERMGAAVHQAASSIYEAGERDRHLHGMGTTATLAGIADETLVLAQVGDSRAYMLRAGELMQLTRDQSLVASMMDSGMLSAEDARVAPYRNLILQALGPTPTVDVVWSSIELRRGDVLLVCSDGLTNEVDDGQIRNALIRSATLDDACLELIDLANGAGGSDNVTCVIAAFDGEGLAPPRVETIPVVAKRRARDVGEEDDTPMALPVAPVARSESVHLPKSAAERTLLERLATRLRWPRRKG
ncbi:MAG: PP2C family protein-serine/threonine phosphatase [Polyangiales bacterium]